MKLLLNLKIIITKHDFFSKIKFIISLRLRNLDIVCTCIEMSLLTKFNQVILIKHRD